MNISDFSSIGPSYMGHVMPDLLAPGENIISTEENGALLSNLLREPSASFLNNFNKNFAIRPALFNNLVLPNNFLLFEVTINDLVICLMLISHKSR